MANPLIQESQSLILDKWRYDDAETKYQLTKSGVSQTISAVVDNVLVSKVEALELDNQELRKVTSDLQAVVKKLESRIAALEAANKPAGQQKAVEKAVPKKEETGDDDDDDDDDDDFDCFASSDEEEKAEKERLKEERVKNYYDKKAKKPALVAKSNVILDVKPWGDDTDMAEMEKCVRRIEMDGLLWGTSKLVPVGYGIKKLVISTVVEDEKVSIDDLQEQIQEFDDHVQSVDVAAFNKL